MAKARYVGAIDQGTTSTRFVIIDHSSRVVAMHQLEHKQIFPRAGWVEHNPLEIWDNTLKCFKKALQKAGITAEALAAIGITNQRETTVVWDPVTGKPWHNAIVWQDTRTTQLCRKLAVGGDASCYQKKVGLPLATYFSGPKIRWILDNVTGARSAARKGRALFGNLDSYLIWNLTGGTRGGTHVTDVTNASRTMLMNLDTLDWDDEMLAAMNIPGQMLPFVLSSSEVYGKVRVKGFPPIPVSGDLGDQQAALFGQGCFKQGDAKNTYGTGCFLLLNTGSRPFRSRNGLLTTVGYKLGEKPAVYALEGSIALAGSLVQWTRDNLGLIKKSPEIETLAKTVKDNGGIYFVPAFSGLFAPHWRSDARGIIAGMTHFTSKGHIARAVLEATAFQAKEIFHAMEKDSRIKFNSLKVDGGMTVNELLMQFQADILGINVIRPRISETTVLGAAYAAGLAVGFWKNTAEVKKYWRAGRTWKPGMATKEREGLYRGWKKAVTKSFDWEK